MTEHAARATGRPDGLSWSDRFRGAMLGGAVGDALGAGIRRTNTAGLRQWFGPRGVTDCLPVFGRRGAATELTQLTVFTLESLLRAKAAEATAVHERLPIDFVRTNHLCWLHTQGVPWQFAMQSCAGQPEPSGWLLGRPELFSTRNPSGPALYGIGELAAMPPEAGYRNPPLGDSNLMEAVVWAAPTMVWGQGDGTAFFAASSVGGLLTADANVRGAGGLHADVLAQLLQGVPLWDAVTISEEYRLPRVDRSVEVNRTLHTAMFAAQRGRRLDPSTLDMEFDVYGKPGELGIALSSVATAATFTEAVLTAVNHSADSSVTGALAGQLAGAIHGPAAIPERWRAELELGEIVETLCADAAEAFAPPHSLPRWAQRYVTGERDLRSGPRELEPAAQTGVITEEIEPVRVEFLEAPGTTEQAPGTTEQAPGTTEQAGDEEVFRRETEQLETAGGPEGGSGPPTQVIPVIEVEPESDFDSADKVPGESAPAAEVFPLPYRGLRHSAPPGEPTFPETFSGWQSLDDHDSLASGFHPAERAEEPLSPSGSPASPDPVADGGMPVEEPDAAAAEHGWNEIEPEPSFPESDLPEPGLPELTADEPDPPAPLVDGPAPPDAETPERAAAVRAPIEFPAPDSDIDEEETGHRAEFPPEPAEIPPAFAASSGADPVGREEAAADPAVFGDTDASGQPHVSFPPVTRAEASAGPAEAAEAFPTAQPVPDGPDRANEPAPVVDPDPVLDPDQDPDPMVGSSQADDSNPLDPSQAEAPSVPAPTGGGHAAVEPTDAVAPSLTERVLGCFLGSALGDALCAGTDRSAGERFGGEYGTEGHTGFGSGTITADTQLTLFIAEGLIRGAVARRLHGARDPLGEVRPAYRRWLHTQGMAWEEAAAAVLDDHSGPDGWLIGVPELFADRSPDGTTLDVLREAARGTAPGTPAEPVNDSAGCAVLARVAPAALWSTDPAEVFDLAARGAALTHGHPNGYLAAGAFTVIVQQALLGSGIDDGVWLALQVLETWRGHEETSSALALAVDLAAYGVPSGAEMAASLGTGEHGHEALAIAVCATLATGQDVELALRTAVGRPGSERSAGAVCGSIVGALAGIAGLPVSWLADLELREVVERMAMDCVAEFDRPADGTGGSTVHRQLPGEGDWHERYPVRPVGAGGADESSDGPPTWLLPAVEPDDSAERPLDGRRDGGAEPQQPEPQQPEPQQPEPQQPEPQQPEPRTEPRLPEVRQPETKLPEARSHEARPPEARPPETRQPGTGEQPEEAGSGFGGYEAAPERFGTEPRTPKPAPRRINGFAGGRLDTGPTDTGPTDTGPTDTGPTDSGPEANGFEAGRPETTEREAASPAGFGEEHNGAQEPEQPGAVPAETETVRGDPVGFPGPTERT